MSELQDINSELQEKSLNSEFISHHSEFLQNTKICKI